MLGYVDRSGLQVASCLAAFIENELLLNLPPEQFWDGYFEILKKFMPKNRTLLAKRDELQAQIDTWHRSPAGSAAPNEQAAFLRGIGYLVDGPEHPQIKVRDVDDEIAAMAGPQLVVPVMNARFALNATNARWGSLYDALYGTDAIEKPSDHADFDPARAQRVVEWVRAYLDRVALLDGAKWSEARSFSVVDGRLQVAIGAGNVGLSSASQFAGRGEDGSIFLRVNGLLIRLCIDKTHRIARHDLAGISDVLVEAALTVIQDCEDSVAAVDAEDKCQIFTNWLQLMRGDLSATFIKNGLKVERRLAENVRFTAPDGNQVDHPGRALLLVRNVGLHMYTDAVMLDGQETPEGILDALVTVAAALHDRARPRHQRNSRAGSIYVVKPKLHGPEEAAFTDRLFDAVEDLLELPRHTVKLGLMDEERRTSVNLAACIAAIRHRCVFINTGFLDRTGDEIHTAMELGPVVPRAEMPSAAWLKAYEDGNVAVGLAAGLRGRAQIGKGMWAKPDAMAEMLASKIAHPLAGASTAWVPSPTAAVLHATHYHLVRVTDVQAGLASRGEQDRSALFAVPMLANRILERETVRSELDNACQSILGYVVRWVDFGIGCSKVPDITGIALMEDRATLRISSQHLANWLRHEICTVEEIDDSLRRMAERVDAQNASQPDYRPMAPAFDGEAFGAARRLILDGAAQPSGYVEPILHAARRRVKQSSGMRAIG